MRLILAIALIAAPLSIASAGTNDEHVKITLLSEQTALVPGKATWLGIELKHEPHWHTYWINPGDSGLPTKLNWQLPQGFGAGDIIWPAPKRIAVGELYNFGYEGEVLLPVQINVPADVQAGSKASLWVEIKWLVCQEQCIPGKARLALVLPVQHQSTRDPLHARLFTAARAAQPQPSRWQGEAQLHDDRIDVTLRGADLPASADAFVVQRELVNYTPPRIVRGGQSLTLSFPKSDYFTVAPGKVDLVLSAGTRAWSVSAPFVISPSSQSSRGSP